MSEDFNKSDQISDDFFKNNTKPDFSIKDIKQEKTQRTLLFNMKVEHAKKSNLRDLKKVFEEFYRTHGGQLKRDIEKSVALEKHEVVIGVIIKEIYKKKVREIKKEISSLSEAKKSGWPSEFQREYYISRDYARLFSYSRPKSEKLEIILKKKIDEMNKLEKKLALSNLGHWITNDKSEETIFVSEIENHENLSASDGLSSKVIAPAIRKEEILLLFQTYMKAKIPGLKQVCLRDYKDEETRLPGRSLVLSW